MLKRLKIKRLKKRIRKELDAMKHAGKHSNASLHQHHYETVRELYRQLRSLDPHCPLWKDLRAEPEE